MGSISGFKEYVTPDKGMHPACPVCGGATSFTHEANSMYGGRREGLGHSSTQHIAECENCGAEHIRSKKTGEVLELRGSN